jgi:hypothetical protein
MAHHLAQYRRRGKLNMPKSDAIVARVQRSPCALSGTEVQIADAFDVVDHIQLIAALPKPAAWFAQWIVGSLAQ